MVVRPRSRRLVTLEEVTRQAFVKPTASRRTGSGTKVEDPDYIRNDTHLTFGISEEDRLLAGIMGPFDRRDFR